MTENLWLLLVVAALGASCAAAAIFVAKSFAEIIKASVRRDDSQRVQLEKQDEFTMKWLLDTQAQINAMASGAHVHRVVTQQGLGRYMRDAESALLADIRVVMENLDVDEATAKRYLVQNIVDPAPAPVREMNGGV